MSVDAEGYGFPEHQQTLARLMDDIRVLSPAGVERVASGWDDHVGTKGLSAFHEAEKAATHAIEQADRGAAWDTVRSSLFGLTESGDALVSWKAEHGDIGHKAERPRSLRRWGLSPATSSAKSRPQPSSSPSPKLCPGSSLNSN